MEKRVYRPGAFVVEQRATRALLKFCADHGCTHSALADIRESLAALEVGEKSNAVTPVKRIHMGKEGCGDWWPPAASPAETEEYAWAVFEALVERWYRLMRLLGEK